MNKPTISEKVVPPEIALLLKKKDIDWEQRRYEIAKAALIGELASPVVEGIDPNPSIDCVCKWAVLIADTLIEKLKEDKQ